MKYEREFPLEKVSTKVSGLDTKFNLATPEGRKEYFEAKVGDEIARLREFLKDNTFIAYLLAKKSAGKGTYTKLLREIFGEKIVHVSVGDVVRAAHKAFEEDGSEKDKLYEFLKNKYRGYISLERAVDTLLGRSQDKLLPTEFTLALIEHEIDKSPEGALFVDGFPRDLDQVSYALFFRNLIGYREDPDVFIAIDIPESVIDERVKYRVICPVCHVPRNVKLLRTQEIGYDEKTEEFYLLCDEHGERMVPKEGDASGIAGIRERLDRDGALIDKMFGLHGVPKVLLRNALPKSKALDFVDEYELTPEYRYTWDTSTKKVVVEEVPWTIKDDEGKEVYSLLAPPVVVSFIKQLVSALGV